jgi:hypothetical protein
MRSRSELSSEKLAIPLPLAIANSPVPPFTTKSDLAVGAPSDDELGDLALACGERS